MNGIINVVKPANMTSFDVVAYLRKLTGIKKIGHTGTLDPMATGVLPICIGKATGVIDYILNSDKKYVAEITFGANTETEDNMGRITEQFENNASKKDIKDAICSFKGSYMQMPPMYSAIKINGQKLCDIARKGKTVERQPRQVNINDINVLFIEDNKKAIFECCVSKGTYVRTLCYDIGKKLGIGAYMSFLVRTKVGDFDIDHALTLEKIKELNNCGKLSKNMQKPDCVLGHYPRVILTRNQERLFLNGGSIKTVTVTKETQYVRVYNQNDDFLAIGSVVERQGALFFKSKKMFV